MRVGTTGGEESGEEKNPFVGVGGISLMGGGLACCCCCWRRKAFFFLDDLRRTGDAPVCNCVLPSLGFRFESVRTGESFESSL